MWRFLVSFFYLGSPARALLINNNCSAVYFFEAETDVEYDTICELNLRTNEIRRLKLKGPCWSMIMNSINNCCYALELNGTIHKLDIESGEEVLSNKITYPHDTLKSNFCTLKNYQDMIIAVGYLKTPKHEKRCPNRVFLLDKDCRQLSYVDVLPSGMIFCRLPSSRLSVQIPSTENKRLWSFGCFCSLQRQRLGRPKYLLFLDIRPKDILHWSSWRYIRGLDY